MWVQIAIFLFFVGPTWKAIVLFAYGAGVISSIDNILKPMLLSGAARVHPLLGFLSVIGGTLAFGPAGLLVGPMVLSLAISALHIYRSDFLVRWGPSGTETVGAGAGVGVVEPTPPIPVVVTSVDPAIAGSATAPAPAPAPPANPPERSTNGVVELPGTEALLPSAGSAPRNGQYIQVPAELRLEDVTRLAHRASLRLHLLSCLLLLTTLHLWPSSDASAQSWLREIHLASIRGCARPGTRRARRWSSSVRP